MIGVEINQSLRSGPTNVGAPSGAFHIAGVTERGPSTGRIVVSIAEFEAIFGGRTPYTSATYDAARTFFEEGGAQLVVSRVVGPAATKGFLVLKDSSDKDTVRIEVNEAGPASSDFRVTVTPDASAGTFSIIVTDAVTGQTAAAWTGASSPADLVALAYRDALFTVTDLGSQTAGTGANPKQISSAALSAGTDDRAGITKSDVIKAINAAGDLGRGGALATPGWPASVIGNDLLAAAAASGKIALMSEGPGATEAEVTAAASALTRHANASYGGVFWPHMLIPDGTRTRVTGPEAYVAAVRARAHTEVGYWQVPAGERAGTRWVLGTTVPVSTTVNNRLEAAHVNGIVTTTDGRTRLYGWSSLSLDTENLGQLSAQDFLNNLRRDVQRALEPLVFETLDHRKILLGKCESAVVGVLDPIAKANGVYARVVNGEEVDPGYSVRVDGVLNPLTAQAQNEVHVAVAVRLSPTAQLIRVEIIKVALTAAV